MPDLIYLATGLVAVYVIARQHHAINTLKHGNEVLWKRLEDERRSARLNARLSDVCRYETVATFEPEWSKN